jgi:hypothetical protein
VPQDHPPRGIRRPTYRALERLSPRFGTLYVKFGRPSVPPEKLLRALLLQALYSFRSERQLMEQLDYNILFRWFVGLGLDDAVWSPTTFIKNRDRLLDGDVAAAFFEAVPMQANAKQLLSESILRSTVGCSRRGPQECSAQGRAAAATGPAGRGEQSHDRLQGERCGNATHSRPRIPTRGSMRRRVVGHL